jgi:hypothetical protein
MTQPNPWDLTLWGVTDWLGVVGFVLAALLGVVELLRGKPRVHIEAVVLHQRLNDAWHSQGIQISVANVGGAAVTVLHVTVEDRKGGGRPFPGTSRVPPELGAEPEYGDNPRLPVVVEPGGCVTFLAGRPWLEGLADGPLDQWQPKVSVLWLRPRLMADVRGSAKRSTVQKVIDKELLN